VLVILVVSEAVQYIGSISYDIVDYPSLLGNFFYMARYSMFHMFARRLVLDLL
jgi:hypothetical protein